MFAKPGQLTSVTGARLRETESGDRVEVQVAAAAVRGHPGGQVVRIVRGFALRRGRYELSGLSAPARHRRRKASRDEDGPKLVTQGSTEFVHALLANDLVDAMTIFTVPVVLGGPQKAVCRRLGAARPQADKMARFEHGHQDRTLRVRR